MQNAAESRSRCWLGTPGKSPRCWQNTMKRRMPLQLVPAAGQAGCGQTAVELVRDGRADFLMKGFVETRDLLRPLVKRENGLNLGRTISHMAFLQVPGIDHLLVITDGGMVTIRLWRKSGIFCIMPLSCSDGSAMRIRRRPRSARWSIRIPRCLRRWTRPGWPR